MKRINLQFIDAVLGPLIGGADDDEQTERYRNFDSDNELLAKDVIAKTIKIAFESRGELYKLEVKKSLAYSLLIQHYNFEGVFDSALIAFEVPSDPRNFFLWMWEALFPGEPVSLEDKIDVYKIVVDLEEPLRLAMAEKLARAN